MKKDSVTIRVTPGEFVVNREATKKNLAKLKKMNKKHPPKGPKPRGRTMLAKGYDAGGKIPDKQTRIDNQLADAQGATRGAEPEMPAKRSDQGVRPSTVPQAERGVKPLTAAQKAAAKALGFNRGGLVKSRPNHTTKEMQSYADRRQKQIKASR